MGSMEQSIAKLLACQPGSLSITPVGGGCISQALRVDVADGGKTWFVKSGKEASDEMFRAEARSLTVLADAASGVDGLLIPEVAQVEVVDDRSWLIMPWIHRSRWRDGDDENFGRKLAALHRSSLGSEIGFSEDTFLGASRQPNAPEHWSQDNRSCNGWPGDWTSFVAEYRIGFQLRMAIDNGYCDEVLRSDADQLIEQMDQVLAGRDEATSLLHGDLWSGNFWGDPKGRLVMIDPAIYHGCREAELGMLRLFGSRSVAFYDAYHESFPLPDGWQRRVEVYVLYHLLNHLNLFGTGYLGQCKSCLRGILRS